LLQADFNQLSDSHEHRKLLKEIEALVLFEALMDSRLNFLGC
jgi:hypothetical protein